MVETRQEEERRYEGRTTEFPALGIRAERINRKSIAVRCRRKIFLISGEGSRPLVLPHGLSRIQREREREREESKRGWSASTRGNHLSYWNCTEIYPGSPGSLSLSLSLFLYRRTAPWNFESRWDRLGLLRLRLRWKFMQPGNRCGFLLSRDIRDCEYETARAS